MAILNKLISKLTSKRLEQIDYFRKNPFEVQQQTFINLINEANNTIWGKKFAYNEIKNFNDYELFTNRVPISSYNELKPFIDRVRSGEQNVLWSSEIKWFAKSSGTTADKSKFIPVSNEALEFCHFRGGRDVLVLYSEMFPETNIFKGRALGVGGSQQISNMDNDMYYGDLSAVLIENLPFWADFLRTPSKNIALHPEWEEKIEQMAKITSKQNVTNISGVPSWTLVLLKKILEITGKNNISEVWENLELFVHGGVSFVPYFEEYKRFISSQSMRYMETYNASEGFFSIQDDLSSDDMLLMLDYGIFYEFIRLEDVEQSSPKIYTLMEVELKTNYAIIISTNGGLWRYLIGDTIIFTSKKPFKIKITGRTKHFINAFGEEVIIDNAETALKIACEKTNSSISEYTAAPLYMSEKAQGSHQWLIEFSKLPNNLEEFVQILDNELKSVNSDYEAKRYKGISLKMPELIVARKNLFYEWLKNNGKLGGQHKVPRLNNNRIFIDQLLEMNNL